MAANTFIYLAVAFCSLLGAGFGLAASELSSPSIIACPNCWHPVPTTESWYYQLDGRVKTVPGATVYAIDGHDNTAKTVSTIHNTGARAICYISAGSWERWRSDASDFPRSLLGRKLAGYPDERWLDIRRRSLLMPLMIKRMKQCKRKGFDAVELDNVTAYAEESGFPLTYKNQLAYNRALAEEAHKLALAAALKNDLDQIKDLVQHFDFAINEQCFEYDECKKLKPFIAANKAVFEVEYSTPLSRFCPKAAVLKFSAIKKRIDLKKAQTPCTTFFDNQTKTDLAIR